MIFFTCLKPCYCFLLRERERERERERLTYSKTKFGPWDNRLQQNGMCTQSSKIKNKINRGIHFLSLIISHERLKGSERKQSFHYNNPKTNTIAKNEAKLLIGLHAVTSSIQNKDSYHTNIDWIRTRMFKLLNFCWSNTNTRRRAMVQHGDDSILKVASYVKCFMPWVTHNEWES